MLEDVGTEAKLRVELEWQTAEVAAAPNAGAAEAIGRRLALRLRATARTAARVMPLMIG